MEFKAQHRWLKTHPEIGAFLKFETAPDRTTLSRQYKKLGEELIEFVEDRPGHDKRYSMEYAKIKALGWKPRYNFERALEETITWYKENRDWWAPLKKPAETARLVKTEK